MPQHLIPFYITITKPNKHRIEVKNITGVCREDDVESAYKEIIKIYQEELQKFPELPDEYDEFVNGVWFKDIPADAEPLTYGIFIENKWVKPWELEDLYEEACEIVEKLELITGYINTENGFNDEEEENPETSGKTDLTELEEKFQEFKQNIEA